MRADKDKYTWRQDDNYLFINPYNFVPLGKGCKREKSDEPRNLTGSITCTITPKSDVFIPNTSNENAFNKEHKSFDFYSYTNLEGLPKGEVPEAPIPAIPGSELRGMIRSVYEALTDSCLSMDYTQKLYTRSAKPKEPGILSYDNGKWKLYKANNVRLPENIADELQTGKIVRYNTKTYEKKTVVCKPISFETKASLLDSTNKNIGIVLIGEWGANKKYEHIFTLRSEMGFPVSGDNITEGVNRLKQVIDLYKDKTVNLNISKDENPHFGYNGYKIPEKPDNDSVIPVFFQSVGNKYYFAPAAISKNVYTNTLENILDNHVAHGGESYKPCSTTEKLCQACSLFGTVIEGIKKNNASGSRVRFSDAHITDINQKSVESIYRNHVTLKELAEPKFRCVEYYTHIDDNRYIDYNDSNADRIIWNFDFLSTGEKRNERFEDITTLIKLNGRKFYWHNNKHTYEETCDKKISNDRSVTVRPLSSDANVKFEFKVFFDKISRDELNKLVWVLNLGENENSQCHKIGMGKPLGLGSIKIDIKSVNLREIDYDIYDLYNEKSITSEFTEKSIDGLPLFNCTCDTIKAFLKMSDFNSIEDGEHLLYPGALSRDPKDSENKDATFQWFVGNKQYNPLSDTNNNKNHVMTSLRFAYILPKAIDKNPCLPEYTKDKYLI